MAGHKGNSIAGRKSLILAVMAVVFSFSMIVGASGKISASTGYEIVNKGEGLLDRAWKFIGNMANVFIGDEEVKTEAAAETETVNEASDVDYMMLINANNPISRDYKPVEMVDIAQHVSATKTSIYLEKQAAGSYINMINAMKEDGVSSLSAVSGYRDFDYQTRLHNAEISKQRQWYSGDEAKRRAARVVAAPGTSEHQSGLAIDVSSRDIGYVLSSRFADTESFVWIREHAHEYGFIVRYAKDKTDITGVIYEPWHLRYVGELATDIYESGLCLEEYIELN